MKIELKINGDSIVVETEELLTVNDINDDMNTVAAHIGYWTSLHAAAEREKVQADSYYRQWRAKSGKALLSKDSKLAEWKIRQEIEGDKTFRALKNALSDAAANVIVTRGICEALRTKASMLQSKGAMMRAELDATSMSTPGEEPRHKKKKTKLLNDGVRKTFKTSEVTTKKKKKKKKASKI